MLDDAATVRLNVLPAIIRPEFAGLNHLRTLGNCVGHEAKAQRQDRRQSACQAKKRGLHGFDFDEITERTPFVKVRVFHSRLAGSSGNVKCSKVPLYSVALNSRKESPSFKSPERFETVRLPAKAIGPAIFNWSLACRAASILSTIALFEESIRPPAMTSVLKDVPSESTPASTFKGAAKSFVVSSTRVPGPLLLNVSFPETAPITFRAPALVPTNQTCGAAISIC